MNVTIFADIFEKYRQKYIDYSYGYVQRSEVAEDIVIDSFIAVWQKKDQLSDQEFPAYLMTTVKNKSLNYLRGQKVRIKTEGILKNRSIRALNLKIATLEASDPDVVFSGEVLDILNMTLSKMPLKTRDIFVRSRFHGETNKQIAENLGLTIKSIEYEMSKAIKLLRFNLQDYFVAIASLLYLDDFL